MQYYYDIVQVNPEWAFDQESMGSKKKFWYWDPDDPSSIETLFKYPRQDRGEHWAEKIAAEISKVLDIAHADVELASCEGQLGTVTFSFTRNRRGLFHGNQLLELIIEDYNPQQKRRPSNHTLFNIFKIFDLVFPENESSDEVKRQFGQYLLLDAVIGNTDRHHENWGLLRERSEDGWKTVLAPTFDHASSLGRELSDEVRNRRLRENSIGEYSEKAPGGIYWSAYDRKGIGPLSLVRRANAGYPDLFRSCFTRLAGLDEETTLGIVNRIPVEFMTRSQREFAVALISYNLEKLRELS